MQLTTIINIPTSSFRIESHNKIMFLGSCFADSVGEKFATSGFNAMINPFGTLYNPMSIAELLQRCIDDREYCELSEEIFRSDDDIWHSWMHHSRFSAHSSDKLVEGLNSKLHEASRFLRNADVLVVTLGTAIIYRLKENGMLVANCHKQHDSMFIRERLSVDSIVDKWVKLVDNIHTINPDIRILFTVSPIRHKRDGMHINNISKGILLQAVDEVINNTLLTNTEHKALLSYFPSYEIMLDELRDYRFYADDMIHPSPLAVEYIWQRFQDTYFDSGTKEYVRISHKEYLRSQHRPIVG